MPGVFGGNGSPDSGSTTFTDTAGTGRPTEPSLQSTSRLCDRLGGTFTDTNGESSVVPYPSTGRTPNFCSNASHSAGGNFSAPATTMSSDSKSDGSHRRK